MFYDEEEFFKHNKNTKIFFNSKYINLTIVLIFFSNSMYANIFHKYRRNFTTIIT